MQALIAAFGASAIVPLVVFLRDNYSVAAVPFLFMGGFGLFCPLFRAGVVARVQFAICLAAIIADRLLGASRFAAGVGGFFSFGLAAGIHLPVVGVVRLPTALKAGVGVRVYGAGWKRIRLRALFAADAGLIINRPRLAVRGGLKICFLCDFPVIDVRDLLIFAAADKALVPMVGIVGFPIIRVPLVDAHDKVDGGADAVDRADGNSAAVLIFEFAGVGIVLIARGDGDTIGTVRYGFRGHADGAPVSSPATVMYLVPFVLLVR